MLPKPRRLLRDTLGPGRVDFLFDNEALRVGNVLIEHGKLVRRLERREPRIPPALAVNNFARGQNPQNFCRLPAAG